MATGNVRDVTDVTDKFSGKGEGGGDKGRKEGGRGRRREGRGEKEKAMKSFSCLFRYSLVIVNHNR
ncbi:MAG: hypothetical protein EAZ69_26020 [Oscillatoriales cyanobacterium]|nr:MAG: hypothetical protein EAZ69_26020 [Oscillatoriales cyanobacterium]